jgi:hypothetical protein
MKKNISEVMAFKGGLGVASPDQPQSSLNTMSHSPDSIRGAVAEVARRRASNLYHRKSVQ